MPTKDDDKKAKDHNAENMMKNRQTDANRKAGKHSYSKKTDHL
ncbi:MAG: DUF3941 domain-containing protein [Bacillus sp. (in: firmicutes)]